MDVRGTLTRGGVLRWLLMVLAVVGFGLSAALYAQEDGDLGDDSAEGEPAKKAAAPAAPGAAEPSADEEAEEGGAEGKQMTWLENLMNSGIIGLIIVVLSIFMVAMIISNFMTVRRAVLLPQDFLDDFENKLKNRQYPEAYQVARSNESFIARVLAAGLAKLSAGADKAMSAMEDVGAEENMRLEHRLSYLAMVGTVAPMLGLLGTVAGMIASFNVIASKATTPKASELAGGISMALMTTLMGLLVAIPAIAFYGLLRNRAARLVVEVGMLTEDILGRLTGGGAARPAPAPRSGTAPASGARPAGAPPSTGGLKPSGTPRPQAPPPPTGTIKPAQAPPPAQQAPPQQPRPPQQQPPQAPPQQPPPAQPPAQ